MSYTVRQNPASPNNYDDSRAPIDMVVIHHAASTSFDSIGQAFKQPTRNVSAHYGVGQNNNVDQYVPESKTAWHAANYPVNQRSIGIENVNASGAPNWDVADSTKNTLVELVTDIVRRNPRIGKLVVGQNLVGHKDVSRSPTACPGQLEGWLQELANRVNAAVGGGGSTPTPAPQPGKKSNDQIADEVLAGNWGNNPERRNKLIAAGYDYNAIQAIVNNRVGNPASAPKASNELIADQVLAGAWGNNPERQQRLQAAGYDYGAIQNIVNRKLGIGGGAPAPSKPTRLSDAQVADQVLAGAWGNGEDRRNRLVAAGYSYNAVQSIVNEKLGQNTPAKASNDTVANQVIHGDWGNGEERKSRLAAAGYDYGTIQGLVNQKLGL